MSSPETPSDDPEGASTAGIHALRVQPVAVGCLPCLIHTMIRVVWMMMTPFCVLDYPMDTSKGDPCEASFNLTCLCGPHGQEGEDDERGGVAGQAPGAGGKTRAKNPDASNTRQVDLDAALAGTITPVEIEHPSPISVVAGGRRESSH